MSLFSGAGGFEIGFERAGIETVLQAEIDPWALEVLGRHWPNVAKVTDVRDIHGDRGRLVDRGITSLAGARGRGAEQSGIDLVYGGFPCQDLSVAGKRAGLGGARSGLWSEFRRVLSELRPRWMVAENVPGLLSSGHGRDFGRILLDLEELGYGWAYRVLDARWFGVAQRRRRVFIVAGPTARAAAQVLAVCESCGGHPTAGRETGQDVAATVTGGSLGTRSHSKPSGRSRDVNLIATPIARRGRDGGLSFELGEPGLMNALRSADGGSSRSPEVLIEPARCLTARGQRLDAESDTMLIANSIQASAGHHGHSSPRGDGSDNLVVGFNHIQDPVNERGTSPALGQDGMAVAVFDEVQATAPTYRGGLCPETAATMHTRPFSAIDGMLVRRLTPLECERLMGWPDFWTRFTADGREIPDSHRYRLIGNGVVSTCAEWIGWRLMAVDRQLSADHQEHAS